MAEDEQPGAAASMTLMAGPIDTRINPTKVNELADQSSRSSGSRRNLISRVPRRYPGAVRRVYPGFVQLAAFMSMNLDRHVKRPCRAFHQPVAAASARRRGAPQAFYDEYFAVLDLPAEFYLETVSASSRSTTWRAARSIWRGRRVDPAAIRRTALLTVEGENDDICAIGQTLAAQELCTGLHPSRSGITCRPGSGTTACSAGAAGRPRSIRASAN